MANIITCCRIIFSAVLLFLPVFSPVFCFFYISSGVTDMLDGAAAMIPTAGDWIGLALVAIVLPAVLSWVFGLICRKLGWIKDGDLKLQP